MLILKFHNTQVLDEVSKLESQYKFKFPSQYRNFLINYNGGYTPNTYFEVNGISSDIKLFYGFGVSSELSFSLNEMNEWIEKFLFPIAIDSFGDDILIGIAEENYGKVFFSDHERGMTCSFLAEDFSSFVDCCKSSEISENMCASIEDRKEKLIRNGKKDVITPELIELWKAEINRYQGKLQEEVIIEANE